MNMNFTIKKFKKKRISFKFVFYYNLNYLSQFILKVIKIDNSSEEQNKRHSLGSRTIFP